MRRENNVTHIYKYKLEETAVQSFTCKAVKILDIQIQYGNPVMWAIIDDDIDERTVTIVRVMTGPDAPRVVQDLQYITTTSYAGIVYHWFYLMTQ
jgi:hypothetical protein